MQADNKFLPVFFGRGSTYATAAVCVLAVLTAGCGGGGGNASGPSQQGEASDGTSDSATRQVAEQVQGPFRITASLPKRTYRVGEAIEVTCSITNVSSQGAQVFVSLQNTGNLGGFFTQFSVQGDNRQIFNSVRFGNSVNGQRYLNPGETQTETVTWQQWDTSEEAETALISPATNTAAPGEYRLIVRSNMHAYFDGDPIASPEPLMLQSILLSDGKQVALPPLNITIEP